MKQESFSLYLTKIIFSVVITVSFGLVIAVAGYLSIKPKPVVLTPIDSSQVSKIEISSDNKLILDADTKEVIFTIEDTQKYLKDSGYEYNPETFQTTNAKYAGDCFGEATLSNKKDRIVFSTSCFPGDLPQSWIGVYNLSGILLCIDAENKGGICPNSQRIKFLASGSGRNFVWSSDDKNIIYEADIGLSGMTETRTIDSQTGEILKWGDREVNTADWKIYNKPETNFTFKYPRDWEIKADYFYETAKGIKAINPTVILRKIGNQNSNDEIRINARQFNCENGGGTCIDLAVKGIDIYADTYTEDYKIEIIFDKIIESFKLIKNINWKTYRNEKYGFEVNYPREWRKTIIDGNVNLFKEGALPVIEIKEYDLKKNQSFKDVMIENTMLGECGVCHPKFKDFKLRKIGNSSFYYIFPYLSEGQFSVCYWIVKDNFVLEFSLMDDVRDVSDWMDSDLNIDEQNSHIELNQILSTFKFITASETELELRNELINNTEFKKWLTERNKDLGFSIKPEQIKFTIFNSSDLSKSFYTTEDIKNMIAEKPDKSPQGFIIEGVARIKYSFDKTKALLQEVSSPDSSLILIVDIDKENFDIFDLGMCGTACSFDDFFWLKNDQFVVIKNEEINNGKGDPECIQKIEKTKDVISGIPLDRNCNWVSLIRVYDLNQ